MLTLKHDGLNERLIQYSYEWLLKVEFVKWKIIGRCKQTHIQKLIVVKK